ncbi:Atp25 protein [Saccharomycopsis crataegensis]|uniref:ATPase synthesis protein 25 n=1 Tax=Saccharomycopsis crataegensis TaxID=43959 RepID=A0AAV5QHU3_9ASCO|nr:Atp25 protein [Saccharomycopsis crataegensis]
MLKPSSSIGPLLLRCIRRPGTQLPASVKLQNFHTEVLKQQLKNDAVINETSGVIMSEPSNPANIPEPSENINQDNQLDAKPALESTNKDDDVPWYMREDEDTSFVPKIEKFEMPELPENSPQSLENIVSHMGGTLSLSDLVIMDMTKVDPSEATAAPDFSRYMIIGCGKSSKHIMKASIILRKYLKNEMGVLSNIEGLNYESAKKANKRMKRSVRKRNMSNVNDLYGGAGSVPNSWVMIDTDVDGIYIHILTQERREELNLEYLWAPKNEKHKYEKHQRLSTLENDDIFAGIRYYHTLTRNFSHGQIQTQLQQYIKQHKVNFNSAAIVNQDISTTPADVNINSTIDILKTLSDEEFSTVFERSQPVTKPFSSAELQYYKNPKGQSISTDIVQKINSSLAVSQSELDAFYEFFDYLFQKDPSIVDPISLRKIISAKVEPLTIKDIIKLSNSFVRSLSHAHIDGLVVKKYVTRINELLRKYSEQGGSLDFTNEDIQVLFLDISKIVFHSSANFSPESLETTEIPKTTSAADKEADPAHNEVPTVETTSVETDAANFTTYKSEGLIAILSDHTQLTYAKINDRESFELFLGFKEEILVRAMHFYIINGFISDFWSLWKNQKLWIAPNLFPGDENDLNFQHFDSRPWKSFLLLGLTSGKSQFMEQLLKYFSLNYHHSNLERDDEVLGTFKTIMKLMDPKREKYPAIRELMRKIQ